MTRCPDCRRTVPLVAYREGRSLCADCLYIYYGQSVADNDNPQARADRAYYADIGGKHHDELREDGLL